MLIFLTLTTHIYSFYIYALKVSRVCSEENCLSRKFKFFLNWSHAEALLRNKILEKIYLLCKWWSYLNFSLTFLYKTRILTFIMLKSLYISIVIKSCIYKVIIRFDFYKTIVFLSFLAILCILSFAFQCWLYLTRLKSRKQKNIKDNKYTIAV